MRRTFAPLPWLGVVLALAAGCTQKLEVAAPLPDPDPVVVLVTPDSVQAIYSAHCGKCHGGTDPLAGLNLSTAELSWRNTVNVTSIEDLSYVMIAPGDPANSYLLMKLSSDPRILESPMPLGDPPLPAATQLVIAHWVAQGALPDTVVLPAALAIRF